MNVEITITWYDNEPAGFWFNDRLIWENNKIITETNLLETKISLPFLESIKFSTIFLTGLIADYLVNLLEALKIERKRLEELQIGTENTKDYEDEWDNFESFESESWEEN